MPKKSLIVVLSIVVVVLIAGGVVAALWLTRSNQSAEPAFVEKDLGACSVVSRDAIAKATDGNIENLGIADNRGYAYDADGEVQTCGYNLSSSANEPYNNLRISVTVFSSAEKKTSALTRYTDIESVGGVGESTYFSAINVKATNGVEGADDIPEQNLYRLYAFKDLKLYEFTITQHANDDAFTDKTAQSTLLEIAKSATL